MKLKQGITVAVIIMLIAYSCRNKEENYMQFTTDAKKGEEICIEVDYPEGETVWADLNNNDTMDEGEKLERTDNRNNTEKKVYCDEGYCDVENNILVANPDFKIHGIVTYLYCPEAQLTKLDITHNPHIEQLVCVGNYKLTELDIHNNPKLNLLYFTETKITEIDISNNKELTDLRVNSGLVSNVHDIKPKWKSTMQNLEKQNIAPKGYHIVSIAKGDIVGDTEEDLIVFFKQNVSDTAKASNLTKMIVFEKLENNKLKNVGEYEEEFMACHGEIVIKKAKIEMIVEENLGEFATIEYNIKNGSITKVRDDLKGSVSF